MSYVWLVVPLGLVACAPAEKAPSTEVAEGVTVVRIGGSETLKGAVLDPLAKEMAQLRPDMTVEVVGGGTGEGYRKLIAGELDVMAASRLPTPAEIEQAEAAGINVRSDARRLLALDVVGIATDASHGISELTEDQVKGIWCDGTITDWSQVGGNAGSIHAYTRDTSSGTRAIFEDYFCGVDGFHRSVKVQGTSDGEEVLGGDADAIMFGSVSGLSGQTLALKTDDSGTAALPTAVHALNGTYPLSRELYLYVHPEAPIATDILFAWLASGEGQAMMEAQGLVAPDRRLGLSSGPRPIRQVVQFTGTAPILPQRDVVRLKALADELVSMPPRDRHVILEVESVPGDSEESIAARSQAVKDALTKGDTNVFFEEIPRQLTAAPDRIATSPTIKVFFAADEEEAPSVGAAR